MRQALDCPLIGVLPPDMTLATYERHGVDCAVLPTWIEVAASVAKKALLEGYLRGGTTSGHFASIPEANAMHKFVSEQGQDVMEKIERQ